MNRRRVEDELREEYFMLLPSIKIVKEQLEAEVRYELLSILDSLLPHERYEIQTRVKECESAINALRRRQEGNLFDDDDPEKYSLKELKDLAGVRILAFPRGLVERINSCLKEYLITWTSDHVPSYNDNDEPQALKYYGICNTNIDLYSEVQIVPMLTGLFWKVEHEAIYKPKPEYKNISDSFEMQEKTQEVLNALKAFEITFEKFCKP